MIEQNIHAFLSCLDIHNGTLHGDWVQASCPLAFARHRGGVDTRPSFGILVSEGRSGYYCFSCNLRGASLDKLLTELHFHVLQGNAPAMDLAAAYAMVENENEAGYIGIEEKPGKEFEEWPEWWLDAYPMWNNFPSAATYLHSRGVSAAVAHRLDLRFDWQRKAIGFPIRNHAGKFSGMRGRRIVDHGLKHYDYTWNKVNNASLVFLGEHEIDFMRPVVVVEGPFDYASVYRVYRNVVANLSAALSIAKVKRLATAIEVIGLFDNDEAGKIASVELSYRIGQSYREAEYPSSEIKDPGECSREQIAGILAPYVPLDEFLD